MFKKLFNGPTGTVSGPTVTVTPSMSFDQMAAEQNAKRAAALAERRAAGDPSQLKYVVPQDVMNAALMTGTGVKTGSMPSNGSLPSTVGVSYATNPIPNASSFSDYFQPNPYAIAPPPSGTSRVRQSQTDLIKFGGRRLLCKSKKGVRKSASRKRCRRKGKRSRKAQRR